MNPVYDRWKFCEQFWDTHATFLPSINEFDFLCNDDAHQVIMSVGVQHLVHSGIHIRRSLTVPEHLAPYHFVAGVETAIAEPSDFATAVENGMKFLMGGGA